MADPLPSGRARGVADPVCHLLQGAFEHASRPSPGGITITVTR
jgi:hypothetical protein